MRNVEEVKVVWCGYAGKYHFVAGEAEPLPPRDDGGGKHLFEPRKPRKL